MDKTAIVHTKMQNKQYIETRCDAFTIEGNNYILNISKIILSPSIFMG